jgi:hypothetical protein
MGTERETPDDVGRNSWAEWRKLVLNELESHRSAIEKLNDKYSSHSTELAILKVKSGLWGAAAGAIITVAALLFWMLTGHKVGG